MHIQKAERGVAVLRIDGGMPRNNNGHADVFSPHPPIGNG